VKLIEDYWQSLGYGFDKLTSVSYTHLDVYKRQGGGPSRGDGRALFQANLNMTIPERLVGSVSFKTLQNDHPVSGTYEFSTLDGKRKFKGSFQATWGNSPAKVIR